MHLFCPSQKTRDAIADLLLEQFKDFNIPQAFERWQKGEEKGKNQVIFFLHRGADQSVATLGLDLKNRNTY